MLRLVKGEAGSVITIWRRDTELAGYDRLIVGGGVVGLTLAKTIKEREGGNILILEKEDQLGAHASGRNSGVLHAGLYYKPETLKAKLCVKGSRMMKEYCREHDLPLKTLGKVVVPHDQSDKSAIEKMMSYGKANGVPLELLDQKGLKEREPAISEDIDQGIYSPSTAIVNPKVVLERLSTQLQDSGVTINRGERVTSIDPQEKKVVTTKGTYNYGHLVNCAGAYADRISHQFGVGKQFRMLPFKGLYYKLSPVSPIKITGNIYPVPDLRVPFLGVHFTKSVGGDVYVGPTAIPALGREHYRGMEGIRLGDSLQICRALTGQFIANHNGFRTLVRQELPKLSKSGFFKAAQKLAPQLKPEHLLSCEKVGIRAQLYDTKTGLLEMDFNVERGPDSTHVLNAVSPAFTCSLSFADYVYQEYLA